MPRKYFDFFTSGLAVAAVGAEVGFCVWPAGLPLPDWLPPLGATVFPSGADILPSGAGVLPSESLAGSFASEAGLSSFCSDTASSVFPSAAPSVSLPVSCFTEQPAKTESISAASRAAINLRIFIESLPNKNFAVHIIAYFPKKRYRF